MPVKRMFLGAAFSALILFVNGHVLADGIVSKIVNSPLSATGLVRGAHAGINIYLQSDTAPGLEFMDPYVIGYGVPAGGRIEIELDGGYKRDPAVPLTQKTIMVVTGAPQQGMPGKAIGYTVSEGRKSNIIVLTPNKPAGLVADTLMSPAPGAKGDPVRQRGIKVFHIGLLESAFINHGKFGRIKLRIFDGTGQAVQSGTASVDFIDQPAPQIQPNNFPDKQRNHNWQTVKRGQALGQRSGTLPIPIMLYDRAQGIEPAKMKDFKDGLNGVGVVSTQQLAAAEYVKPKEFERYNGGLIIQDTNGDGQLDPKLDRIIGGVIGQAPPGAKGQELRSLEVHGAIDLSKPSSAYNAKFGKIFGGAVALLQFTAGDKPGLYRPTLALLRDPDDLNSGDGSSYTYTIVVE